MIFGKSSRLTQSLAALGNSEAVPKSADLDGGSRFVDDESTIDTGPGTAPIVDIGAYEVQRVGPCPWDLDANGKPGRRRSHRPGRFLGSI